MVILEKNKFKKNEYFYIESPENITLQKKKKIIITIPFWRENKKLIKNQKFSVGIRINSDESFNEIIDDLLIFDLIQFNFLTFKDGRPFTFAKILKEEMKFRGEIRASGHLLPDQYIFLIRSGFDTVEVNESKIDTWIKFYDMNEGLYYQK